jgi:hypothetical protein
MNTLTTLRERFDTSALDHLDDIEVPILTGPQRQGDVMIVPTRAGNVAGLEAIGAEGIAVVRGENGGNTHLLLGEGDVQYAPKSGQILGTIVVNEGATAWLTHPEHGFNGVGPGTYMVTRQREQAEEIRLVAD